MISSLSMQSSNVTCRFSQFLVDSGCLLFGDFTLKSGESSPFFLNFAQIDQGSSISMLGQFFAEAAVEQWGTEGFDVVLGPAYKGIPIATAMVIAMQDKHGADKSLAFTRKEAKQHGEASRSAQLLTGTIEPGARVVIVDDVLTSGGTKLEAAELVQKIQPEAVIKGFLIGVDRQRRREDGMTEAEAITKKTEIEVHAIAKMSEVVDELESQALLDKSKVEAIRGYL